MAVGAAPNLLTASRHNMHKNVPVALLQYLLLTSLCVLFKPLPSLTLQSARDLNVPCRPKRSKALLF
jgi:hypothetical protein